MREYEELLLKTDGLTAHKQTGEGEEDKLSTIQETASLEGQVIIMTPIVEVLSASTL